MKKLLKKTFERTSPSLFHWFQSWRQRGYFRQRFARFQENAKSQLFQKDAPISVLSGPFEGMRYIDEVVWGSITPKWLGSYEAELHEAFSSLLVIPVDTVIDVGCAEGYYAVGAAFKNHSANIFAFDLDPLSRRQTLKLATLNGVLGRLTVGSFCSHSDLERISKPGKTLVICDIEGAEVQLLDPDKAPSLRFSNVIVEIHEESQNSRDVEVILKERFTSTHEITTILASSRDHWIDNNLAKFSGIDDREFFNAATNEHRANGQTWLSMRPIV